jgi:hypothetical protein
MMKEPKIKEPKHDMSKDDEELAILQLEQLEPNFGKYRPIAEIYMEHGHFPPVPKDKMNDEQYKKDEYAIRLSYCHARGIPEDFANELQLIQGSLGIGIDTAMSLFKSAHPFAQFDIIKSNDVVHEMNVRINPSKPWTPFKFTITEAQNLGYLKKNNVNWEGYNGRQNMIAKNNYSFAVKALDRGCLHGMTIIDTGFYEMQSTSTDTHVEPQKTEVVSFAKMQAIVENKEEPKPTPLPAPAPTPEPIMEVYEIMEPEPIPDVKPEINFSPISKAELTQIKEEKIASLPPPPDHVEIMETNQEDMEYVITSPPIIDDDDFKDEIKEETKMIEGGIVTPETIEKINNDIPPSEEPKSEEPKKPKLPKTKQTKKADIKKEIKKPFPMTQLTINDPDYQTQDIYEKITEDWFASFTVAEFTELVVDDGNIEAFRTAIDTLAPERKGDIEQRFYEIISDPSALGDFVALVYHDAIMGIENPPAINLIDFAYLKLILKDIDQLEKFAQMQPLATDKSQEQFLEQASKFQINWSPKKLAWGYKYLKARELY